MNTTLTDFTFTDTGISVKIRKISPMLAADISASMTEPLPPEQLVDYGEPKGKVMERNYSDPLYLRDLSEYNLSVYKKFRRIMILRGIEPSSLPDGWEKDVAEYRRFMLEQTGKEVQEPEDVIVYIFQIAIGTEDDLNDLINAITRRSQPTAEVINSAKASFQRTL